MQTDLPAEPAFAPMMTPDKPAETTPPAPPAAPDPTGSPEEENESEIPGDPRPLNENQPPTKEQY